MFAPAATIGSYARAERAAAPEDELRERPELVLHHPGGRRAHRLEDREAGQPRRFAHEPDLPRALHAAEPVEERAQVANLDRRKQDRSASTNTASDDVVAANGSTRDSALMSSSPSRVPRRPLRRCERCEDDRRKPALDAPAERGGELLDRAVPRRRPSARARRPHPRRRGADRCCARTPRCDAGGRRRSGHRACRSRDRRSAPRSPRGSTCRWIAGRSMSTEARRGRESARARAAPSRPAPTRRSSTGHARRARPSGSPRRVAPAVRGARPAAEHAQVCRRPKSEALEKISLEREYTTVV